jgi:hypothetical protein
MLECHDLKYWLCLITTLPSLYFHFLERKKKSISKHSNFFFHFLYKINNFDYYSNKKINYKTKFF